MNITSSNIKIYPSSLRDNNIDRNARLTSEQNLISMINRLVDKDSFIVNGLQVSGNTISAGQCSIHGYYFDIITNINLGTEFDTATDLYLGIRTVNRTSTDPGTQIDFIQLVPYGAVASTSLDLDGYFLGLSLTSSKIIDENDASKYYYLHLATRADTSSSWQTPYNSDLKFDISEVDYKDKGKKFINYLLDDYGIDDGEIN